MKPSPRPLRIAALLMTALAVVPVPSFAAGGNGHGGIGGGGRGSIGGIHGGDVFHVRGGSGIGRGGLTAPTGRAEAADGVRERANARDVGTVRETVGPHLDAGIGGTRAGRKEGPGARRRSRLVLRRLFARQRRLETSRCDRTLAERYNAPHGCYASRLYGRYP